MKKFDQLVRRFMFLFLLAIISLPIIQSHILVEYDNQYKVEINRIYEEIVSMKDFHKQNLENQTYVKNVEFISIHEKNENVLKAFYKSTKYLHMEVRPYLYQGSLLGYLRFEYTITQKKNEFVILAELILLAYTIGTLIFYLYVRQKILKPFHEISELPYELSKGKLQGELKESSNRYFGKFIWGLGLLRDKLKATKNHELELEKQKKLMLLSLSHDIKTPLNTIQLYSKALLEDIYDTREKKMEAARQIGEKTVEIERFVNEIIKASSEDILQIEVEQGEFYLKDLIHQVEATYKEKSRLLQIQFTIGSYENKLLKGDMDKILEVIGNIIENAYKYGDGREISITFEEEDYCQLICIHNSGTVVNDNEFHHLFDSFFRGSNSEGRPGNGLGLYIGKKIMNKVDGELFAKKEADGMNFILVIRG